MRRYHDLGRALPPVVRGSTTARPGSSLATAGGAKASLAEHPGGQALARGIAERPGPEGVRRRGVPVPAGAQAVAWADAPRRGTGAEPELQPGVLRAVPAVAGRAKGA